MLSTHIRRIGGAVLSLALLSGAASAGAAGPAEATTTATHFVVNAPSSATTGAAFNFTVTAEDASDDVVASYAGTVAFTSSDGTAVLPVSSTLTDGTGTFSATLNTAGPQTITATDTTTSSITGTSGSITVAAPAAATHLEVSGPASATVGTAFTFTVTAESAADTVATGYAGTVGFTSSDAAAALPTSSTLTNGTGTFSATLNTAGQQTITATDTTTSSITGTSAAILVVGPTTHLAVSGPADATVGVAFTFTVTAEDANDDITEAFSDDVAFGSSDPEADLPATSALTNGTGSFTATLNTAGTQTITATDTTSSSITGTTASIAVGGPATQLVVSAPTTVTPDTSFTFTVTAEDASDDVSSDYTDIVAFTSSDATASLPASSTLTNGTATFTATLNTPGSQTITATDTSDSSIAGSAQLTVLSKSLTQLAGVDRIATAIAVSQSAFPSGSAGAVVLARADTFADGLAGGPLAAAKDAPLLLTPPAALDPRVASEMQRVLAPGGTVYLLGGTDALSAAVEAAVTQLGFQTVRLAGADRFATAVQVATAGLGSPTTVILATGDDFADALSGAPAATQLGAAILLTDDATMPSVTAAYLTQYATQVYALGGPAAAADPSATATVGADRYETAAMVATQWFPDAAAVGFASGANFPDGLSGGAQMAHLGGPVLLVDPSQTSLPPSVVTYLQSAQPTIESGYVYGGSAAIPPDLVTAAGQLS